MDADLDRVDHKLPERNALRVAIDTGGTFTDCVYLERGELRVLKVFSTPANPAQAVLDGLASIGTGKALDVRHGTTVGTNTMLERKGARVAFVTTAGFEDTIAIGRQTRSKLYDWFVPLPVCPGAPVLALRRAGTLERRRRDPSRTNRGGIKLPG